MAKDTRHLIIRKSQNLALNQDECLNILHSVGQHKSLKLLFGSG